MKIGNNLPPYLFPSVFLEIPIRSREGSRSEKSIMSREWARMRTRDDMVSLWIDNGLLRYSRVPPENEDNSLTFFRKKGDHSICQLFPSFSLMRCSFSLADCEDSIEQQHSLFCPICEIRMSPFYSHVRFEFSEDISEAWLSLGTIWYRERESHSSPQCMVWVLSEDHDLHLIEWSGIEGSEDISPFWEASSWSIFLLQELSQDIPIWFLEFVRKNHMPWWVDCDSHIGVESWDEAYSLLIICQWIQKITSMLGKLCFFWSISMVDSRYTQW